MDDFTKEQFAEEMSEGVIELMMKLSRICTGSNPAKVYAAAILLAKYAERHCKKIIKKKGQDPATAWDPMVPVVDDLTTDLMGVLDEMDNEAKETGKKHVN